MLRSMAVLIAGLLCFQAAPAFSAETKAPAQERPSGEKRAAAVRIYTSLTPPAGCLINNARPTISAEYVDEGIGVSPNESKLYIDGADVTSGAQLSPNKIAYAPSAPIADGAHKVKLDIIDKAGNPSTVSWSFTIHTLPPKIKITSHKPGQFVNRSPVYVSGTVDDARSRVVVNGIAAAVERGTFSAKVNIVEGANTITAVATDAFGNSGLDSVSLVLDSKPPTVEITAPTANNVINTRSITVVGIVDNNAASVTVGTRAGGQGVPAEMTAGAFTAKELKLEEGVNTITAKAVSQAGNAGTASVKVTVDSLPPKVAITSPRTMAITNKKMISVTGTVDDPTAMVKINNTPVQVSKGGFSLSGLNLSEGNNTITATAIDRAGNQATASVITVVLDTTPPAPPTLAALPSVTRVTPVIVTGNTEPGAQVEVYDNSGSKGAVKADEKGAFSLRISLAEGNNAITAIAYDANGNASGPSAVVNVFLDTKPPKIL